MVRRRSSPCAPSSSAEELIAAVGLELRTPLRAAYRLLAGLSAFADRLAARRSLTFQGQVPELSLIRGPRDEAGEWIVQKNEHCLGSTDGLRADTAKPQRPCGQRKPRVAPQTGAGCGENAAGLRIGYSGCDLRRVETVRRRRRPPGAATRWNAASSSSQDRRRQRISSTNQSGVIGDAVHGRYPEGSNHGPLGG